MSTRIGSSWFLMTLLLLTACGAPLAAREAEDVSAPAALPQYPPYSCPVTQPPDPAFIPPSPYPPEAPYGDFWYGSAPLWTLLQPDGRWDGLPSHKDGYGQKVLWWREGYDMTTEQQPDITVSGRRLDGDGETFEQTGATNGYQGDVGEFMLTGVSIPAPGCWEITGYYRKSSLSFVVWVAPGE